MPKEPEVLALTPVPPPPPPPVPAQENCFNQKGYCVSVVSTIVRGVIVIVKDKENKIVLAVSLKATGKKDKQYERTNTVKFHRGRSFCCQKQ